MIGAEAEAFGAKHGTADDPAGAATALRREGVAHDMHAIFAKGHGAPAPRRASAKVHVRMAVETRHPGRRNGRRALRLAAFVCLAGTAVGLAVVAPLRDRPATMRAPMPSAASALPRPTALMASVQLLPPDRPTPVRATAAVPTMRAPAGGRTLQARFQSTHPADAASFEPSAGCDADGQRYDACRRDVLAADRDLRLAYMRAVDSGVERDQLVSIRNRWARLRAMEYDRPDDLLVDYAALTDRLDREAQLSGDVPH